MFGLIGATFLGLAIAEAFLGSSYLVFKLTPFEDYQTWSMYYLYGMLVVPAVASAVMGALSVSDYSTHPLLETFGWGTVAGLVAGVVVLVQGNIMVDGLVLHGSQKEWPSGGTAAAAMISLFFSIYALAGAPIGALIGPIVRTAIQRLRRATAR